MKRVSVKHREEETDLGVKALVLYLVDEEGNELSDAETWQLFQDFEATGLWVKTRWPEHPDIEAKQYPGMGVITGYTVDEVILSGDVDHAIPKADFHKLYELD